MSCAYTRLKGQFGIYRTIGPLVMLKYLHFILVVFDLIPIYLSIEDLSFHLIIRILARSDYDLI